RGSHRNPNRTPDRNRNRRNKNPIPTPGNSVVRCALLKEKSVSGFDSRFRSSISIMTEGYLAIPWDAADFDGCTNSETYTSAKSSDWTRDTYPPSHPPECPERNSPGDREVYFRNTRLK